MKHVLRLAILLAAPSTAALAQNASPAFQARAFADLNYTLTQLPIAEGFRIGQIVGHVVAGLSDRVTLFGEVSATPSNAGFSVEAERLFLRYDHNDLLKVSAGRYHTPISYWNTAFHHGQWLQTSVGRPDMVRGGSGLLPLHFVGVLTEGVITHEALGLRYAVGAGNGRGSNIARAGDAGDANNSRALVASTTITLPRETGFSVGGSFYSDRISPTATLSVDERITTFSLSRERETPEVIVEYSQIIHKPRRQPRPTTNSNAAYAQIAYRLPGVAHAFKPYARVERTRVPAQDTIFAPLRLNFNGVLGGIRYDLAPTAAIKVEYRAERFQATKRFRTLAVQLSFTFPSFNAAAHGSVPDSASAAPNERAMRAHQH